LPEGSFVESATRSADSLSSDMAQEGSLAAVKISVIAFCRDKLHVDHQPGDISSAHRMRKGDKDSTRPIIVRFVNFNTRDKVLRGKKSLRSSGSQIFISEHLTHASSKLFFEARALVRLKKLDSA